MSCSWHTFSKHVKNLVFYCTISLYSCTHYLDIAMAIINWTLLQFIDLTTPSERYSQPQNQCPLHWLYGYGSDDPSACSRSPPCCQQTTRHFLHPIHGDCLSLCIRNQMNGFWERLVKDKCNTIETPTNKGFKHRINHYHVQITQNWKHLAGHWTIQIGRQNGRLLQLAKLLCQYKN